MPEFAGRHNMRPLDTHDQMSALVRGMDGKRLPHAELAGDPEPVVMTLFDEPW